MTVVTALLRRKGELVISLFAAALIVAGIAARVHQITYNFDGDELFSTQLASRPLREVIARSLQDRPHPPLYNILLHVWIGAFGASELSVRLLSVLLSVGFLLFAYV